MSTLAMMPLISPAVDELRQQGNRGKDHCNRECLGVLVDHLDRERLRDHQRNCTDRQHGHADAFTERKCQCRRVPNRLSTVIPTGANGHDQAQSADQKRQRLIPRRAIDLEKPHVTAPRRSPTIASSKEQMHRRNHDESVGQCELCPVENTLQKFEVAPTSRLKASCGNNGFSGVHSTAPSIEAAFIFSPQPLVFGNQKRLASTPTAAITGRPHV